MALRSRLREPATETITVARDVWFAVLWLLAAQVLDGVHDHWLGWWIFTPLAATAQTMALIRLVVYAFRGRQRKGG